MSGKEEARSGRGLETGDPPLEEWIFQMARQYRIRAKRRYRLGMTLRAIILVCASLAVLPDSAVIRLPSVFSSYGIVTSVARVLGALLFLLASNLRISEAITTFNEIVSYLEGQIVPSLTRDGLSRQMMKIEIYREVTAREAALEKNVFAGLHRYFGASPDRQD